MRILLLGNTGYLGSQVEKELLKKSYVFIGASKSNGVDCSNYKQLKNIILNFKPNFIINCAALTGGVHFVNKYSGDILDKNIRIGINLYKVVAKHYPSSIIINTIANCIYPSDLELQTEEKIFYGLPHESVRGFADSRRVLLYLSSNYEKQYYIKSINWIVPNIYGPGDSSNPEKTHVINGLIIRMINSLQIGNSQFELWGDGTPRREFIYITDVARLIILSLKSKENIYQNPINMAQGETYSVMEIAKIIAEKLNYDCNFVINKNYLKVAPFRKMDTKLFRKNYPAFTFTPIKAGILETIKYYKKILLNQQFVNNFGE